MLPPAFAAGHQVGTTTFFGSVHHGMHRNLFIALQPPGYHENGTRMAIKNRQTSNRVLGITVMGDFILSEGPDAVIDNLKRVGANAVACNPTVTAPADETNGTFQPPADANTSPRLFDRPLFGRRALWVRSGPSYEPRRKLYASLKYGPRKSNDLTSQHGHVIGEFIHKSVDAGLKVYLQLGAAEPTGMHNEDRSRMPHGKIAESRLADTGSLASPDIRKYNRAYARDLVAEYPQISGFRIDWPESPCYTLGELFQDFSEHVASWASTRGFDFELAQRDTQALYDYLLSGQLTNSELKEFLQPEGQCLKLLACLIERPGILEWLRLKSALSADLVRDWRDIVQDVSAGQMELTSHAFMMPWSVMTGLNFRQVGELSNSVSPKFYTMHWPLMIQFWGTTIRKENPHLDENLLTQTLVHLVDMAAADESLENKTLADYRYPEPDEPHPVPESVQLRKLHQVRTALRGADTQLVPLIHGYGPDDDFARRLALVVAADVDGTWINRYGYLSEAKLQAVTEKWTAS